MAYGLLTGKPGDTYNIHWMDPECWSFIFDFLFCASFAGYTKILTQKKEKELIRLKMKINLLSTLDLTHPLFLTGQEEEKSNI